MRCLLGLSVVLLLFSGCGRAASQTAAEAAPANSAEEERTLLPAEEVLQASLVKAKEEEKHLLVYWSASWCMWCHVLEDFLAKHPELFEPSYVIVKIDETTMSGTDELGERLGKESYSGIPWMAILDDQGNPLATSNSPEGNIGFPQEPQEIEHFLAMLEQTAARMTADELAEVKLQLQQQAALEP